ncbi:MAG TPA: hypothetical protein VJ302_04040, partial [Blastocatellia bacterium]|nr:hypothetical protein [Blastocatellia bacterium]
QFQRRMPGESTAVIARLLALEDELCSSDSLADSRRADEKSELGSVLIHSMLIVWHCQLRSPAAGW